MQRRGINKRLSFAEAENGQKDRNKEEVEEEREPATEKGINKSGEGERAERKKSERERVREKERRELGSTGSGSSSQVSCRFARPTSRSTTFAVYGPSFRIESFYFRRVQKSNQQPGRCPRVSLGPLLSNYSTNLRMCQKWNKLRKKEEEKGT